MYKRSLNGECNLYFYEQCKYDIKTPGDLNSNNLKPIKACVPGDVMLDLSGAGILPEDLFKGENIIETEKFETYEWWYEIFFDADEEYINKDTIMSFEGVDCIAEYWLNGCKFAESSNMLIKHEFDVGSLIKEKNVLHVRLKSPVIENNHKSMEVFNLYSQWQSNLIFGIRKARHSAGWDIMPRAVTSGIWRDINLVVKDKFNFEQIYYTTVSLDDDYAQLRFCYELNIPDDKLREDIKIEVRGICEDSEFCVSDTAICKFGRLDVTVENPKLWFPYGYGDPWLYETEINIFVNGVKESSEKLNVGIRTAELIRTGETDGKNGTFKFRINGIDVMCRGTNWVPLDAFHSRDINRYDDALALLKDIGCNMVRCWGGNVYEQHYFFDFCDKNGIMVWQDFGMACGAYPQDDEFLAEMKKEVTAVVKEFRNHSSLVLWSGDNEIDIMMMMFGVDPSFNRITREIIPGVINMCDVNRPYLPSSPYISDKVYKSGDYSLLPEHHLWGPRDYFKSNYYMDSNAHFISEIGYHGCPSPESIKKFIDEEYVWPCKDNRQWNLHSSSQDNSPERVELMFNQIKQLFGEVPQSLEEFSLASQITQAEAKKFFIENIRCNKPIKSGIIWWNLLDGWPQMSDAVVDYYFEKKLAYYYIKASQQPFVIMCGEINSWNVKVIASNDTLNAVYGNYVVKDADSGETLLQGELKIKENSNKVLGEIPVMYSDKKLLLIEWNANGKEGFNHYVCGMPPLSVEQYKTWLEKIKCGWKF